jgi:hypothetical protein
MDGVYEAAALTLRFWFMFAAAIVLLGVTSISIKEYRDKRYVLGVAHSSIGYMTILSGPDDVMGSNISLMNRNTIGRSRRVDIVFSDRSVDKAHSQIYQTEDGLVYVNCLGRGDVTVNCELVDDVCPVYDGDVVCFGNVVARVHLKENDYDRDGDE